MPNTADDVFVSGGTISYNGDANLATLTSTHIPMKIVTKSRLVAAVLSCCPLIAGAQVFVSGSNGSYGTLNVTSNTVLDLPPDGIFHCTTIDVQAGYTLSFNRNPGQFTMALMEWWICF